MTERSAEKKKTQEARPRERGEEEEEEGQEEEEEQGGEGLLTSGDVHLKFFSLYVHLRTALEIIMQADHHKVEVKMRASSCLLAENEPSKDWEFSWLNADAAVAFTN